MQRARDRSLVTIATAFDRDSVTMLEQVGVDAFKVASGDLTHTLLIEQVARTGVPLILDWHEHRE